MMKTNKMKEEIQLEFSLFKKTLYMLLISVAICSMPNLSFSQENSNGQESLQNSEKNELEKPASTTLEKTLTASEEKLNAIREVLISEALKSKAKVKASSWIDTNGSLHENLYVLSEGYSTQSSSFKNSINEKGFNINQLKSRKKAKYCRFSNPTYARVAEIIVNVGRSSLELPYNDLEMIREKIKNLYEIGVKTHQNWVFVQSKPVYKTSYERFLTNSSLNKAEYRIEIQIQPVEKFSFRKKRNHVEMNLSLKITDLNKGEMILSSETFLPSPWADPPPEAPRSGLAQIAYAVYEANQIGKFKTNSQKAFSALFARKLSEGVSTVIKDTVLAFDCRQISFPISEITNDMIYIDAGHERGIRIGDQLLLTDSDMIPHRILEESALERIALVEIEAVTAFKAQARRIAGPDLGPISKKGKTNINVTPL